MESWMISLGIVAAGVISSIAVTKQIVNQVHANQKAIFERLDTHGDDIVKLNTKAELAVTAKDVDEKYLSKELFRQHEKHMDRRFDDIKADMGKIIYILEKNNTKGK